MIDPFGAIELMIHFFLASSFETLELNHVQIFFLLIIEIGFKLSPFAITILQPAS